MGREKSVRYTGGPRVGPPRPRLLGCRGRVPRNAPEQPPRLHHRPNPSRIPNVRRRIRVQDHQVGPLPRLDRAQVPLGTHDASRAAGRGMECLQRREPRGHHLLQLEVQAGRNLPDVGARADRHAAPRELHRRLTRPLPIAFVLPAPRRVELQHPLEGAPLGQERCDLGIGLECVGVPVQLDRERRRTRWWARRRSPRPGRAGPGRRRSGRRSAARRTRRAPWRPSRRPPAAAGARSDR